MSTPDPDQPTLVLTPIRAALPRAGGTLEVMVRIQAPAEPIDRTGAEQPRTPLRLALVVDRSGSMAGTPLAEALRCVDYIAGRLQPTDQLAVVLYDNNIQVPYPLAAGGDSATVQRVLASVESGGSTALFDGWRAGTRQLEPAPAGPISRVLLLSDGQANAGLCDQGEIEGHCQRCAAEGISTTTVGLGRDFNENLMIAMARAGGGRNYYGQTAEDLHDGFDEELALLEAMLLRHLRVKLVPGEGVIVEPLGLLRHVDDTWLGLSDLAWGAEAWMLVRLHVAPSGDAVPGPKERALLAVTAQAEWRNGVPADIGTVMLTLPQVSTEAWRALPPDELVARRLQEVSFADESQRIRVLVTNGEVDKAKLHLARLEKQVANEPWLADKVKHLGELLERDAAMASKEMLYSANILYTRVSDVNEGAYAASETDSAQIPAFLRRKASEGKGRKR